MLDLSAEKPAHSYVPAPAVLSGWAQYQTQALLGANDDLPVRASSFVRWIGGRPRPRILRLQELKLQGTIGKNERLAS